jgi:protein TonB
MIDMAPLGSPPIPPAEQLPGPKQIKTEMPRPKVVEDPVKTPLAVNPAVAMPVRPPELPREENIPAPQTTAPPARPLPPAPVPSNAAPTWQGLVLERLHKFRRYPPMAQSRREQGVPYIRFVMDRDGRILSSRLERSSGFAALDQEAVSLPRRTQPLPKPPAEVPGATIELVVPVEFFLRR